MSWPEIEITYRVTLDPDLMEQAKTDGRTAEDVKRDLRRQGINSKFVADYDVEEVGNVTL